MTVALVVGGSGGIGQSIVHRLAADGADVVVGYHRAEDAARRLVDALPDGNHGIQQVSVTDQATLAAAHDRLATEYGRLDVLVNGAGVTRPVPHDDLEGLDDDLIDEIFRANWRGPFATIRALKPLLLAADGAVVVNISSVAGTTGQGSNVAYCASKAALDSMTRSLARSLAPDIRMVSVSPGWVLGDYADRMPREVLDAQRGATPLGRLARPDDVAATVAAAVFHLPMTTGAILPVDGGRPLGTA